VTVPQPGSPTVIVPRLAEGSRSPSHGAPARGVWHLWPPPPAMMHTLLAIVRGSTPGRLSAAAPRQPGPRSLAVAPGRPLFPRSRPGARSGLIILPVGSTSTQNAHALLRSSFRALGQGHDPAWSRCRIPPVGSTSTQNAQALLRAPFRAVRHGSWSGL